MASRLTRQQISENSLYLKFPGSVMWRKYETIKFVQTTVDLLNSEELLLLLLLLLSSSSSNFSLLSVGWEIFTYPGM